jgi:hypothetical protein
VNALNRLAAVGALIAMAPAVARAQACIASQMYKRGSTQHWTSSSRDSDQQSTTVRVRRGDCELRLDARGTFAMRPDLRGFERVDDYVEVEERNGDHNRRVRVTNKGGTLDYRWTVDGTNGFDVDRDRWLGDMLLGVERLTGSMAKTRVPALLKAGGVDAVLDETSLLASDYAKRQYYFALLSGAKLTEDQADRVLRQAADSMSSDYERSELVIALAGQGTMNDRLARGVINVAQHMSSDYEKRRALGASLNAVGTSQSRVAFLQAATGMSSDYERAELLIAAQQRSFVDSVSADQYFKAVERMSSDYERRRTLSALLKQHPTSPAILGGVLRASQSISSDFELASLLVEFATVTPVRGELRELYLKATRSITSDFEYRRALQALLDQDRST